MKRTLCASGRALRMWLEECRSHEGSTAEGVGGCNSHMPELCRLQPPATEQVIGVLALLIRLHIGSAFCKGRSALKQCQPRDPAAGSWSQRDVFPGFGEPHLWPGEVRMPVQSWKVTVERPSVQVSQCLCFRAGMARLVIVSLSFVLPVPVLGLFCLASFSRYVLPLLAALASALWRFTSCSFLNLECAIKPDSRGLSNVPCRTRHSTVSRERW